MKKGFINLLLLTLLGAVIIVGSFVMRNLENKKTLSFGTSSPTNPNFPASLNNFQDGDVINSGDWNAIEQTIGTTSLKVGGNNTTSSLYYLVKNIPTSSITSGIFDSTFIPTSTPYSWTGQHTFASSTIFNASTTFNNIETHTATTTFNGVENHNASTTFTATTTFIGNAIFVNTPTGFGNYINSTTTASGNTGTSEIYVATSSIPANTLINNNVIKATYLFYSQLNATTDVNTIRFYYGGSLFATISVTHGSSINDQVIIPIDIFLASKGVSNSQYGHAVGYATGGIISSSANTISIDATQLKNLSVSIQNNSGTTLAQINSYIVYKIVQ